MEKPKKPDVNLKGFTPIINRKGQPEISLDVTVDSMFGVKNFICNDRIYVPEDSDAGQQALESQKELHLERFCNDLGGQIDAFTDATNLTAEEKVTEVIKIAAWALQTPYVFLQLDEGSMRLPNTIEMVKINGGDFQHLHQIRPDVAEHFEGLRNKYAEIMLGRTEKEKLECFPLPEEPFLQGYGCRTTLQPGETPIATLLFLNRQIPIDHSSERIAKTIIRYFDTMVAREGGFEVGSKITKQEINDVQKKALEEANEQTMFCMPSLEEAQQEKEKRIEHKVEIKDPFSEKVPIDQPGRGFCVGSRLDRNRKVHEGNFYATLKAFKKSGLDLGVIYDKTDRNLALHIARLADAVVSNIGEDEGKELELFNTSKGKDDYRVELLTLGTLVPLARYVGKGVDFSEGTMDFETATSHLTDVIKSILNTGVVNYNRGIQGDEHTIKVNLDNGFPDPLIFGTVSKIASEVDHQPGNYPPSDLFEAIAFYADAAADTYFTGPATAREAIKVLDSPRKNGDNYSAYKHLIGRVVAPPKKKSD